VNLVRVVYREDGKLCIVIQAAWSLIHARMRA
jgi:hypothetical protein